MSEHRREKLKCFPETFPIHHAILTVMSSERRYSNLSTLLYILSPQRTTYFPPLPRPLWRPRPPGAVVTGID